MVPIIDPPQPDGLRAIDPVFQLEVDQQLRQELVRRELAFVDLADQPRNTWLDHVEEVALAKLETPQLRLI